MSEIVRVGAGLLPPAFRALAALPLRMLRALRPIAIIALVAAGLLIPAANAGASGGIGTGRPGCGDPVVSATVGTGTGAPTYAENSMTTGPVYASLFVGDPCATLWSGTWSESGPQSTPATSFGPDDLTVSNPVESIPLPEVTQLGHTVFTFDITIQRTYSDGSQENDPYHFTYAVNIVSAQGPSVNAGSGVNLTEGQTLNQPVTVAQGSGAGGPYTTNTYFDDGSTTQSTLSSDGTYTITRNYLAPTRGTIAVMVTDSQGNVGGGTFFIAVSDIPPTATFTVNSSQVLAGEPVTASFSNIVYGSGLDTDDTPSPAEFNYSCTGDTSTFPAYPFSTNTVTSPSVQCSYPNPGTYTIAGRVWNAAGESTDYTTNVTVVGVTADLSGVATNEGSTVSNSGQWSASLTNATLSASVGSVSTNGDYWYWSDTPDDGPTDGGTVTISETSSSGTFTTTFGLTVANVAPTGTFTVASPVDPGQPAAVAYNPHDPSSADSASLHYGLACTNNGLPGSYGAAAGSPPAACTYANPGTYTAAGSIWDKDGGSISYTAPVTVNKLLTSDQSSVTTNEGSQASATGTWINDSYSGGTARLSASVGTVTPNTTGNGWTWSYTPDDGPANSQAVTITETDAYGGTDTVSFQLNVNNVAPTATLSNNGPINEGSNATVSFSNQADPSHADTNAGFHYAFDCGGNTANLPTTYGAAGTSASTSCFFDDGPSTHTVVARIFDKDNGYTDHSTQVQVNNVAPTAAIANNGPINEGSNATISLGMPYDPSVADTTAGFRYAFDCGGVTANLPTTYGMASTSPSVNCYFDDGPSTHTVVGRIFDKDSGYTTYQTTVTVNNVPPTVTGLTGPLSALTGTQVPFTGTATDPSHADTAAGFSWAWAPDGGAFSSFGTAGQNTFNVSFPTCGTHTITAEAQDKDGGISSPSAATPISVYTASYTSPLKTGATNYVQAGRVLPVQVSVGCGTASLAGLSPAIALLAGDQDQMTDVGSTTITATSSSSADTTGIMRAGGSGYIYNLQVPTASSGTKYTIRVRPFGDSNPAAAIYILMQIK